MCLSPIRIRNPNYGRGGSRFGFMVDTWSKFINIPCGHCAECITWRQIQLVQRVQMESLSNHLFFATLTYNNAMLPHVLTSSGRDIRFADISDLQKMFKRIRNENAFGRPFKYFAVSELGSKRGRPHFHILISIPKHSGDTFPDCLALESKLFKEVLSHWSRNYGSDKKPDYCPLCTYVRKYIGREIKTNYDLHYLNPSSSTEGVASVGFYVLKYMMKNTGREDNLRKALALNLPSDEFEEVWKLVRCRYTKSLGFGWLDADGNIDNKILSHLRKGVEFAKGQFDFPVFINPDTGKTFPLARYYSKKPEVLPVEDSVFFSLKTYDQPIKIDDDFHGLQTIKKIDDYEKKKISSASFGDCAAFDWLDEL